MTSDGVICLYILSLRGKATVTLMTKKVKRTKSILNLIKCDLRRKEFGNLFSSHLATFSFIL